VITGVVVLLVCGVIGLSMLLGQVDEPLDPIPPHESGPERAVLAYYEAIQAGNPSAAFDRFAFDWTRERWDQSIYSTAGCARVVRATELWSEYGIGEVSVDVCVEDTSIAEVKRWAGTVTVSRDGERWVMTDWDLSPVDTCYADCTPR